MSAVAKSWGAMIALFVTACGGRSNSAGPKHPETSPRPMQAPRTAMRTAGAARWLVAGEARPEGGLQTWAVRMSRDGADAPIPLNGRPVAWSSDGRYLLLCGSRLAVVSFGAERTPRVAFDSGGPCQSGHWSPDGRFLLVDTSDVGQPVEWTLVDTSTDPFKSWALGTLEGTSAKWSAPEWNASGRHLLFQSRVEAPKPVPIVVSALPEGVVADALGEHAYYSVGDCAWAPVGSRFACRARGAGRREIVVLRPDPPHGLLLERSLPSTGNHILVWIAEEWFVEGNEPSGPLDAIHVSSGRRARLMDKAPYGGGPHRWAFSPSSPAIASAMGEQLVVWRLGLKLTRRSFDIGPIAGEPIVTWSPTADNRLLLSDAFDSAKRIVATYLVELGSGSVAHRRLVAHAPPKCTLSSSFSPGGSWIFVTQREAGKTYLVAGDSGSAQANQKASFLYSVRTGERFDVPYFITISSDDTHIATNAPGDRRISAWQRTGGKLVGPMTVLETRGPLSGVRWQPTR